MRIVVIGAVAAVPLLFGTTTGHAQAAASPVQQRMRQLLMAEEQYYSDHGTYTTDISALGLMWSGDKSAPQVWLRVYHAGGAGWIGDAQGSNGVAGSCVAFVGDISNFASVPTTQVQHLKPSEEGVIVCDP